MGAAPGGPDGTSGEDAVAGDENVDYPTEYMNDLANTRQTRWETDSSEGVKKIRDALADEDTFGDLPALASYGRIFAQVRTIYLETMRGAKSDLDAVARGIKSSAREMTDNDDAAGAAFVALWDKWENGPLDSTRNQEQATNTDAAQTAAQDVAAASEPATESEGDADGEVPVDGSADANPSGDPDTESEGEIPVNTDPAPSNGSDPNAS